jgi:energy-converting hydrogenase Eha subunit C
MKRNKIIALAIIAFLIIVPFQWAYFDITVDSQLVQAITMAIVILGAVIAIFMFNKDTGESSH